MRKLQKDKKYVVDKEVVANNEKLHQLSVGLPIHAELFEKYRLKKLHEVLYSVVHQDISYHIQAIENLSPVLTLLKNLEKNIESEDLKEKLPVPTDPLGI